MPRRRKPLEGPCELGTGIDSSGPGLLIIKCHQPGVERRHPRVEVPFIACEECWTAWSGRTGQAGATS